MIPIYPLKLSLKGVYQCKNHKHQQHINWMYEQCTMQETCRYRAHFST